MVVEPLLYDIGRPPEADNSRLVQESLQAGAMILSVSDRQRFEVRETHPSPSE
ncbi:hypothetical protein [Propionibacterium freudenreichii]|uniref:hypothetical protein n=1 Tax=Propionibacterium freudenreichii TaxID=1744 RepID=UPI0012D9FF7F|nr:hypothetical protein [Propionibacterium freudenreichii]